MHKKLVCLQRYAFLYSQVIFYRCNYLNQCPSRPNPTSDDPADLLRTQQINFSTSVPYVSTLIFTPILIFLHFFVLQLQARTAQTDGHWARRVMRPIGWLHNNNSFTVAFSTAADLRQDGTLHSNFFCSSSLNGTVKKLLKSTICQNYHKNKSGTFLWLTAYICTNVTTWRRDIATHNCTGPEVLIDQKRLHE